MFAHVKIVKQTGSSAARAQFQLMVQQYFRMNIKTFRSFPNLSGEVIKISKADVPSDEQ